MCQPSESKAGGAAADSLATAAIARTVKSSAQVGIRLEALAADGSDPARQREAIEALGAAGGREAAPKLADIYRGTDSADIREAALEGILISGNDEVMLELFRAADDTAEKRALLEMLVLMDSDAVWEIVDQTLEGGQ